MNMFFATRYADAMFEEDRFQNLVQAAEAYHRRIAGARPDQAAHDARSAAVLAAVPEAHHEWLGEVLETAKEYRLSDRIEALLELHDWMRGDVVPRNVHRWAGRVAMARNYRAHQDPGGAADRNDLPRTRGTDPAPDCLDRSLSTPRDRLRGGSPPRDGAAGKPCVPTPEAQPDLVAVSRIRQSIGASMGRPRSAEYRGAGQPGHSGRSRWFDSSRPDQTSPNRSRLHRFRLTPRHGPRSPIGSEHDRVGGRTLVGQRSVHACHSLASGAPGRGRADAARPPLHGLRDPLTAS